MDEGRVAAHMQCCVEEAHRQYKKAWAQVPVDMLLATITEHHTHRFSPEQVGQPKREL
jgi:hypothetical protein